MYESAPSLGSFTFVDIIIMVFQVLLAIVGALVNSSVNDVRERILRLENLVMGRDAEDNGMPLRRRRGERDG